MLQSTGNKSRYGTQSSDVDWKQFMVEEKSSIRLIINKRLL